MSSKLTGSVFKAYDVRGIYPAQINAQAAESIGLAYAKVLKPRRVAVGGDVRLSTPVLKTALINSLLASGVDVTDVGTITTDQLYFAVGHYGFDGGISVTASHNPAEYNGFKFAERGGRPISSQNLDAMREQAVAGGRPADAVAGRLETSKILDDYINHILAVVEASAIKPFKLVANANFGAVGKNVDLLAQRLGLKLQKLNWQEDGSFPKGPPNPLLPSNRDETSQLIKSVKPDLGVAWDADADRVFFFDETGEFIPSCYIIALLSQQFLERFPGAKIVHDSTTRWVIDDTVKNGGGRPIINRTGHTFIKARMRQEDAPFGGESSGHYYFRDSYYADNGLIPLLMILELLSKTTSRLSELIGPLKSHYWVSGEINFQVKDSQKTIEAIESKYKPEGTVSHLDGLAIESPAWRFSVRASNTEPLLRLNAEARDKKVLDDLVKQLTRLIET